MIPMEPRLRLRRLGLVLSAAIVAVVFVSQHESFRQPAQLPPSPPVVTPTAPVPDDATALLGMLAVKGKAPKTGYSRDLFSPGGWQKLVGGCDTRNVILQRDLEDVQINEQCKVISGTLNDPYTGTVISFTRGPLSSQAVQIDHVVALSNAWQTGAQQLSPLTRLALYNDPLELLAVDGVANNQKGDGDAATWLPSNKSFRCQYVARQIAVKKKYSLWVTSAEKQSMQRVLIRCPGQKIPTGALGKQLSNSF